jgi:hypothetical protein
MDLNIITDFYENLSNNTKNLISKIHNRIHYLENQNDLTTNQILKMNLDLRKFFKELKNNQINQIEVFNRLTNLNLEDGTPILKPADRINLIKNINLAQSTLNKHYDIIPNLNLNLNDLPELNLILERPISPLEAATIQLENLNTTIENS